jgi:hypothetical protein
VSRAEKSSRAVSVERKTLRDELYGPDTDTEYEEDLKACAEQGHEPRIVVCPRCGEDFGEVPEEWYL